MNSKRVSFFIAIVVSWLPHVVQAQNTSHLNFTPLYANPFEPRIGTMYQESDNRLRLDIGASVDLMDVYKSENTLITNGTDFITLTRLRSEGKLKFPVETVDYLFGINFCGTTKYSGYIDSWRVRIAHISAHLADGLAINDSAQLHPKPFVYSREFVDAVYSRNWEQLRLYAGCNFIFSNKKLAKDLSLVIPTLGAEYTYQLCPEGNGASITAAYDVKLESVGGVSGLVHAIQAGVNFPMKGKYELCMYTNYYNGYSIHGLFYDTTDKYWGFGFCVR
ncbi:MAG: DUF1207 domain-containing protein [Candidatus Kapaibacterium sp.]|nr:DUF1207 domain-containing protein [Bacteroidota bacterium]